MTETFVESQSQKGTLAAPDQILVATDLTDSDYLVPHVVAQAKASNAHVTLVHAILPANLLPLEAGAISYLDEEAVDRGVRSILISIAARIKAEGISCDTVARHGFAADVIQGEIAATKATRLIMATHGRKKLAQIALGSVANELLRNVNIPILAVGPHAREASTHALPRKILHPVSLLGDYAKLAAFAIDLAQVHHAELTLLHVLDPDTEEAVNPARTLVWAGHALADLAPRGGELAPVRTRAVCGNPVEEILHAAATNGADWIVLGVDGAFPFWPLRDSTAYKVLCAARCPVLTVRHQSGELDREQAREEQHAAPAS